MKTANIHTEAHTVVCTCMCVEDGVVRHAVHVLALVLSSSGPTARDLPDVSCVCVHVCVCVCLCVCTCTHT